MPRKRQSPPVQVIDAILHSPIGSTLNDKLRQTLGLNPVKSVVDERLKAEARDAGEKIRSRMEEDNRPYKVLGVDPAMPFEDIKTVYLALMKRYHPDGKKPNPKKATELNKAYEEICRLRNEPK